jgi:hypothetical protein
MNGTDNIAGYSLTVGTADMVITDSVALYDPIIGNVTDNQRVSYKIQFIDSSLSTDYETGTGTWDEGNATVSRDTVKTSSNGGALVDFGAGPKVVFLVDDYDSIQSMDTKVETATAKVMTDAERTNIAANVALLATRGNTFTLDVGTTAGTVATGDDPRFGSVDIGDLTPATSIDGTELLPADQGGSGVSITAQQVSGSPVTAYRTLAKDRIRGYSDFTKLRVTGWTATNGGLVDLEPYVTNFSGDASALNLVGFLSIPGLYMATGTGTTNYFALTSLMGGPLFFNNAQSFERTIALNISTLTATGQKFGVEVGFTAGAITASPTAGIYFYADPDIDPSVATWTGVVKNAGGTSTVDTLIPMVASTQTILKVRYDADEAAAQFFVDGAGPFEILNATRELAANTILSMTVAIRKTTGTTTRAIAVGHDSWDLAPSTPLPAGY